MIRAISTVAFLCSVAALAQQSELHRAAVQGDLPLFRSLLDAGAELNARDAEGASPLHYAILYEHSDLARFLLSKNADINAA